MISLFAVQDQYDDEENDDNINAIDIGQAGTSETSAVQEFGEALMTTSFNKDIPEAISVLINFGFYDKDFYYSAEDADHDCLVYQMWDPFAEVCRTIYCSTELEQDNMFCKGVSGDVALLVPTPKLPDMDVRVKLTTYVYANPDDDVEEIIEEDFFDQLAYELLIQSERIKERNVTKVGDKILADNVTINTLIDEVTEALMSANYWNDSTMISDEEMEEVRETIALQNMAQIWWMEFVLSEANGSIEMQTNQVMAFLTELVTSQKLNLKVSGYVIDLIGLHENTMSSSVDTKAWCR